MVEVRTQSLVLRLARQGLSLLLCLSLVACSITGARPVPNTELLEDMQTILDRAEASHADTGNEMASQQALEELVPGLSIADDLLVPVEDRFNIAANGEDAREFFNNLVAGTDLGVLVSPDVEGSISINLPNVTIDEVMSAVQDAYGYTITRSGNIYQIDEPTAQTRIFTIDYLDISRSGSSSVSVSSGNSSSSGGRSSVGGIGGVSGGAIGGGTIGGGGGSLGGGAIGGSVGGGSSSGGGGQVSTNTSTDFWGDIETTIGSMIEEDGSVVVQPQIGVVMVTASPKDLEKVSQYINAAQGILSREVTIQVQFLEVVLNKGYQSAIDFDTIGSDGIGVNQDITAEFGSPQENALDGISNPLTIATDFTDFGAVFRLLESRGTTQVLSSPSLKVLNNQKAVFQDGDQEYFQTSSGTSTVSTGQSVSQNTNNTLQSFFSGISMDITPQISQDGTITLHIHPTITTVTEQSKPVGGEQVPTPKTSVRELDSVIRAQNGKIVMLGGLAYERSVDDAAGIPYAANLPAIGAAFDQRRRSTVKSEFIILLRPIIGSDQAEQRLLRERNDRIKEINRELDPFKN
ncbi:MAG: secretin N-terminal domain-containing protein [Pseudohongiellaceae bacterium]|nr:secretin N-terminal domain-containing protein [Pseudohongiellaceae bacterium]